MTSSPQSSDKSTGLSAKNSIDEICDRFEEQWLSGERPRIEDYLAEAPDSIRASLLSELVPLEWDCRKKQGESPHKSEYESRFRELHSVLTSGIFDSLADTNVPPVVGDSQAKVAPPRLAVGSVVGEYTLLDHIGAGGMGRVFKARHETMDRVVAVKVILAATEAAVERFRREVKVLAKLEHEDIVRAYDARRHEGVLFLVMEYVPGTDLSVLVREKGRLPTNVAVDCILQAAQGLQYAHDNGVIHRDVKPSNLLRSKTGQVKLLDLGLAHISGDKAIDPELTSAGATLGTIDFMSPEQAKDPRAADARSDVYSLGCTLYYLVTGKVPYGGDCAVTRIVAHRESPIPDMQAGTPDRIPARLQSLFVGMVAKAASDRPSSMGQVIAELQAIATPSPDPRQPQYSVATWLLALVAIAACIAMAAALVGRFPEPIERDESVGQAAQPGVESRHLSNDGSKAREPHYTSPAAAPDRAVAELISVSAPRSGARVAMQEELIGVLKGNGWPVVYVRPDGNPYFPQPLVTDIPEDGRFAAQLHFGVDSTPDNMRFKIFVVVARDKQHAQELLEQGSLTALPRECRISSSIAVRRENPDVPAESPTVLSFADRDWIVKKGSKLEPGPNDWSLHPRNSWVDDDSHLHLAIQEIEGGWSCAEVELGDSLAHGEYSWVLCNPKGSLLDLDANATFGFVLAEDAANEIDAEFAAWGRSTRKAQFAIQPVDSDSKRQFDLPDAPVVTCRITWTPADVFFQMWHGEDTSQTPIAKWRYDGAKTPYLEDLRVHMTFFLHQGKGPESGEPQEVVIRKFRFTSLADAGIPQGNQGEETD